MSQQMASGAMDLAYAMQQMTTANFHTQVIAGENLISSGVTYMQLLVNCSNLLDADQKKCSAATEGAATGNKKAAVAAAKDHTEYQIASTKMNKRVGEEDGLINSEEMMEHLQAHDLVNVYGTMQYVSAIFLTTTEGISAFTR